MNDDCAPNYGCVLCLSQWKSSNENGEALGSAALDGRADTWSLQDVFGLKRPALIIATNTQGAQLHLKDVVSRYPGQHLRLYMDATNRACVGLFDNAKGEVSGLSLSDVVEIEAYREAPVSEAADILELQIGQERHAIKAEDLNRLPQHRLPGTGNKYKGALLDPLLRAYVDGYSSITVHSKGEGPLDLTAQELVAPGRATILKLSRKGLLKLRVLSKEQSPPTIKHTLRDVYRIEILGPVETRPRAQ